MRARKFQGDKLVVIARMSRRWQRLVGDCVIPGIAWKIIAASMALCANRAAAVEIQTNLKAMRMETASPVECARGPEIVPFDAYAQAIEIAIKLTPAGGDLFPCALLGMRCLV